MKRILLALLLASIALLAAAQSNTVGVLLSSAARTTTTSSSDVTNTSTRGAHIVVNVTAYTSGTWTPVVEGKDPVSGNYYTILTGPAITSTGMTIIKVYPGIMAQSADQPWANDFLPRTWRITMNGTLSPNATFSVGYLGEF